MYLYPQEKKLKVALMEHSPVVRKIIARILDRQCNADVLNISAVGFSFQGDLLSMMPDVMIVDVDQKGINFLNIIRQIRSIQRKIPIVLILGNHDYLHKSLPELLAAGVNDYVVKPSPKTGSVGLFEVFSERLIPKVIEYGRRYHSKFNDTSLKQTNFNSTLAFKNEESSTCSTKFIEDIDKSTYVSNKVRAVCIGVSTGGPKVLTEIFSQFKSPLSVPLFIVQHMPSSFTTALANRLSGIGLIKVIEAKDGDLVVPGSAYLAPGGFHMELIKIGEFVKVSLTNNPPENSCRPSVDVLFKSAAKIYGSDLLAVVLTGMGQDGLIGCKHISSVHGQVIVQDQKTSVVWGMPGAVVQNNLADLILPSQKIADEITFRSRCASIGNVE